MGLNGRVASARTTFTGPCRGLNPPFPKDSWSSQQHFCASSSRALPEVRQPRSGLVQEPVLRGGDILDGGIRRLPAGRLALAALHGRHDMRRAHSPAHASKQKLHHRFINPIPLQTGLVFSKIVTI
ncbi:hypothetical protein CDAR_546581 [Caerostris darwini]|uniref:Uncharacterized protein n=1 Tax=Caerostris darwini TaxID=1538125 RepID=A0AAV4PDV2_9ARAC|nr:hypothetical protein CDAR_546581 [Caerostris darwini]